MTKSDQVTLRDIMKMQQETQDCISKLEDKIDNKVAHNSEEIGKLKTQLGIIQDKLSNSAKLQMTISVILSAIATYLGTIGIK